MLIFFLGTAFLASSNIVFFAGGALNLSAPLGTGGATAVVDMYNGNTNTWSTASLSYAR